MSRFTTRYPIAKKAAIHDTYLLSCVLIYAKVVTWVSGGGDIWRHYPQDKSLKSLSADFWLSYDLSPEVSARR